jgi:hypothetical protein
MDLDAGAVVAVLGHDDVVHVREPAPVGVLPGQRPPRVENPPTLLGVPSHLAGDDVRSTLAEARMLLSPENPPDTPDTRTRGSPPLLFG